MQTHTQTRTHTQTHTQTCTQTHTQAHTHRHTQTRTHADTHTHTHAHTQTRTHTDAHTYTCTQTCTHRHRHAHTDRHTQTQVYNIHRAALSAEERRAALLPADLVEAGLPLRGVQRLQVVDQQRPLQVGERLHADLTPRVTAQPSDACSGPPTHVDR